MKYFSWLSIVKRVMTTNTATTTTTFTVICKFTENSFARVGDNIDAIRNNLANSNSTLQKTTKKIYYKSYLQTDST